MVGSYFDNVDWQELSKQAMTKAVNRSFELSMDGTIPVEDAATATRILYDMYCKEIWLMGPVPMKKGYIHPTIKLPF